MAVVAALGEEPSGNVVGRRLPARRRDFVEPLDDVLVQPGLVVVDPDAGGDVHRRDQHHPFGDPRLLDRRLDLLGDSNQLPALGGLEGHVGGMRLHCPPLSRPPGRVTFSARWRTSSTASRVVASASSVTAETPALGLPPMMSRKAFLKRSVWRSGANRSSGLGSFSRRRFAYGPRGPGGPGFPMRAGAYIADR